MSHSNPLRYFKSSPEIIRLAVMMYVRFPLSLRNVEDLLHERGVEVSHETIRYWWNRFGPMFAADVCLRRAQLLRALSQWQWRLDEMSAKINGVTHYLWRAVDREGEELEAYVSRRRDRAAALNLLRNATKRYGSPKAVVTDRLSSCGAALKDLNLQERQQMGRWLNNRAENSHLPLRRRERAMQRIRQLRSPQRFASVHSSMHNHFNQDRAIAGLVIGLVLMMFLDVSFG